MSAEFVGSQIVRICERYSVSRYWIAKNLGMRESTVSRWARDLCRASEPAQRLITLMERRLERAKQRETG